MKVAYILATFPSPSETFALREMEALKERGLDITVLAARPAGVAVDAKTLPPTFYRPALLSKLSALSLLYVGVHYPLAVFRIATLAMVVLLECPADFLVLMANIHAICHFARCLDQRGVGHVHGYFMSWPACVAMAVARATKRTMSLSAHARDIFVEQGAVKAKVRSAEFVASCTEQGLTRLRELLPPNLYHKLYMIRHGIEASLLRNGIEGISPLKRQGLPREERILFVGRLVPKKGLDCLVRAFATVRARRVDCTLTIIGEGPSRGVVADLVVALGLGDSVEMLGWRDSAAVADYMRRSILLAVPSVIDSDGDRDGVPNVILEAFACGAVVVASRLDGIAEAVKDGQTGRLVEPGNPTELVEAVVGLLEEEEKRRRLRQRAMAFVTEHFDPWKNAGELAELFQQAAT